MKFNNLLISLFFVATCLPSAVHADNMLKQHTMGLQAGGGGIKYKGKDSDGQGVGNSYWYYNYKFLAHLSAEVGLMTATDIDDWDCVKFDDNYRCRTDETDKFELPYDNFELGALILAAKAEFNVTKRNSFYGKLGASLYDYQFDVKRKEIIDENGTGLFVEAGWQYRWDNGFGLNFSIQNHDMGDLDFKIANIGVNYAF